MHVEHASNKSDLSMMVLDGIIPLKAFLPHRYHGYLWAECNFLPVLQWVSYRQVRRQRVVCRFTEECSPDAVRLSGRQDPAEGEGDL